MITTVSELKGEELINNIRRGIIRKLDSARILVHYDKEVATGLYTYAIEELGKLLLVKESKLTIIFMKLTLNGSKELKHTNTNFQKLLIIYSNINTTCVLY